MNASKTIALAAAAVLGLTGLASSAQAGVAVYVGYYDLAPCCGNPNPLPDPWLGSPNTIFLGDPVLAASSDPDQSGVRFQNTGATSVTLAPGVSVGGISAWDSYIGAGLVIAPGENVILSGTPTQDFDGSDLGLFNALIDFTIDGHAYEFQDTASLLDGFQSFDETIPWTQVGAAGPSGVPEPASWAMMLTGFAGLGATIRRRRAAVAV